MVFEDDKWKPSTQWMQSLMVIKKWKQLKKIAQIFECKKYFYCVVDFNYTTNKNVDIFNDEYVSDILKL